MHDELYRAVCMSGYGLSHFLFFSFHRNTLLVTFQISLIFVNPPIAKSCFLSGTVTRLKRQHGSCGKEDQQSLRKSYTKELTYPTPPMPATETYTFPSSSAIDNPHSFTGRSAHCCHINLRLFVVPT